MRAERYNYSSVVVSQVFGAMQKLVIPFGHSRQSRFGLMRTTLKAPRAGREVGFDYFFGALFTDQVEEAFDEIPIDVLPCGQALLS